MEHYAHYLNQVVSLLNDLPQGNKLATALLNQETCISWVSPQDVEGVIDIHSNAGQCPQNIEGAPIDTSFYPYIQNVIEPQIASGLITDGSNPKDFDDRKVRWSGMGAGCAGAWSVEGDRLTLEVGATTYLRYREDCVRTKVDALKLMLRGLEDYQDPYVYFARTMAVTVIPITLEGTVYVGQRVGDIDRPGLLNFVAGLATFSNDLTEIDFYEDARRELEEEARIDMVLDASNTSLIGIAGDPLSSEIDVVFAVNVNVNNQHFKEGNWSEHAEFIPIITKAEAERLYYDGLLPNSNTKEEIIYASKFGLKYLIDHHF